MGMRSVFDPYCSNELLVDKRIGNAYYVVEQVHVALPDIKKIVESLPSLLEIQAGTIDFSGFVDAANAAAATAAAAAIRAEQSALGKVNLYLDNAVFPATNFTSTFQDNLV